MIEVVKALYLKIYLALEAFKSAILAGKFYKLAVIIIVLIILLGVYGFFIEPNQLVTKKLPIHIPDWPETLKGLKLAVIGDLHIGSPFNDLQRLEHVVKLINDEKPDLIVILGDYIIKNVLLGKFIPPDKIVEELKHLKAPLGVVSVLGNHDVWYHHGEIKQLLENINIKVLDNNAIKLNYKEEPFWIAGISDKQTSLPDIKKALSFVDDDRPVIMLTHHPDMFVHVPDRVALTLAGHSHGGQLRIPYLGSLYDDSHYGQKYVYGHIVEGERQLYITSGIGTSIVPLRIGATPEIAILEIS